MPVFDITDEATQAVHKILNQVSPELIDQANLTDDERMMFADFYLNLSNRSMSISITTAFEQAGVINYAQQ